MEGPIEQAFQERETAYARLEKAITSFCLARHASTEARYNCVVEKRLELLRLRQLNDESLNGLTPVGFSLPRDLQDLPGSPSVRCERAGAETLCRQTGHNLLNYLGG
jgi:hypothetical protein